MTDTNWFIFGAGFSGLEIGRQLRGHNMPVAGTSRSTAKFDLLEKAGIEPVVFDGKTLEPALFERLGAATHLLISISPDQGGDPLVPSQAGTLTDALPNLQWIGYLSTVGVYGDHGGAWVNEETECKPVSARSIERLAAEQAWEGFAKGVGVPLAVLRLSGIYGPGRNTFCNLKEGSAKRIIKPGQVFNRIHVTDIGRAALQLGGSLTGGLFNVTDNEPAPPQDVVTYAAKLMGISPPPEIAYDEASMSPMARSFYGEVKKVSNAKLRAAGFELQYPDYRTALTAMWQNDEWAGA